MAGAEEQALHGGEYRQHLPDLSIPRFTTMQKQDAHEYANAFKESGNPPWLHALYLHWRKLFKEPFTGITTDGTVKKDLYQLADEGVSIQEIVDATNAVLSQLDAKQKSILSYHIDSPEWRSWSNPEFLLSDKGLRLDELTPQLRDSILKVLETTLSPEGYAKALGAMRINGFLGELVKAPTICNEFSYNFVLFGEPSTTRPWGFSFYGHHLCLNIFLYKGQIVASPWFTGAEPNLIDDGPYKGTRILETEERLGLQLMQSLPANLQERAQTYKLLKDPAMPKGRWNHDDQRHLCGAYRDNRIVPYEGILVDEMNSEQQGLVTGILEQYLLYLPQKAREIRINHAKAFFKETYFSWIGGFGNQDPFYYRIQSPVILVEFDHHSGVFLTNKEPAKFHIHTLLRTPNAGDYGMALRPLIPGVEQDFVWEG
ncbi:uncharacterized protein CTRU02_209453 [Colletotrichum truncatum]|uniref:Uncharacterized protein n=1 Tax=Colletotrichum truncatum TaxID=5467 RepID=A0ACC3YUQ9_COLTU|nr:uncharacterized protein CTRU02_08470 [Colletotrichum truncatum]KAF6789771.1 hypothetical protein CTRU02_08470 [Colletotrichum truncatum]